MKTMMMMKNLTPLYENKDCAIYCHLDDGSLLQNQWIWLQGKRVLEWDG